MKKIILVIFILTGWLGNYIYYNNISISKIVSLESEKTLNNNLFECDGRTYCSQMTSCQEATYFINNCPNTKMDGNNDGVPCESQWCN